MAMLSVNLNKVAVLRNARRADEPDIRAGERAQVLGLGVNAGHDLNRENLRPFCAALPGLLEVSIGHALVADAFALGLEAAVAEYVRILDSRTLMPASTRKA